ncbi:Pentatricopeptide repeat-containing protein At5g15300 [Linum grandiflorum]
MIRKRTIDRSTNRQQRSGLWRHCRNLQILKQVHASMVIKGFNSSPEALRELIFASAVAIYGTIDYAHQLFAQIPEPDTFMCNTVMRGSSQSQYPLRAVSVYTRMERAGVKPDNFTFPFLLKACARLQWRNMGSCVHGKVVRCGFEANNFVRNTVIYFHANCGDLGVARVIFDAMLEKDVVAWSALIAGYARRGNLNVARKLFSDMPVKDMVSWNVMITGYAKRGKMDYARELFDMVPERDVVTWNTMIAGYVKIGENEQALKLFQEMKIAGEHPDEVTMLCLLSACSDLGNLETGKNLHLSILEVSKGEPSVLLGNAIISMYAKCGSAKTALEVFKGMMKKDVTSWNSIIGGLALNGHAEESIKLFEQMLMSKHVLPDEITFVEVLIACSHAGKVDEGHSYFDLMINRYGIEPNIKHYGCIVDMLGRAGLLTEAFEFIKKMNIEPNGIIWRTLLGACSVHGDIELGKHATERLMKLAKHESGGYVLLSNIYAAVGEWGGFEKVRQKMDDDQVWKAPGCSIVEADNKAVDNLLSTSTTSHNSDTLVS